MTPRQAASAVGRHRYLLTSCGRQLTVGRLAFGDSRATRVFVDLGTAPGCDGSGWASLTVAEARQLAEAILSQAVAAEQECQGQAG